MDSRHVRSCRDAGQTEFRTGWSVVVLRALVTGTCVTARARCGSVMSRECSELLYGRRFPLKLNGAVYKSGVKPAILYKSEAWCLKESEVGILRRTWIYIL